ncbi:MAG TPA: hypothetical protein VG797_06210 [Phycisphaerales bacterium]|nr:hypothetical protein [Phycisphaerales bacterium]
MTTTAPDTNFARGVLGAKEVDHIVFTILGTDYKMHLQPAGAITTQVGKRILGEVRVQARRVDIVKTGGRYIEPVMGRPRRIQGDVIAIDSVSRTITVNATVPIVAKLDDRQNPGMFKIGDFVAFDAVPGATFTPAA